MRAKTNTRKKLNKQNLACQCISIAITFVLFSLARARSWFWALSFFCTLGSMFCVCVLFCSCCWWCCRSVLGQLGVWAPSCHIDDVNQVFFFLLSSGELRRLFSRVFFSVRSLMRLSPRFFRPSSTRSMTTQWQTTANDMAMATSRRTNNWRVVDMREREREKEQRKWQSRTRQNKKKTRKSWKNAINKTQLIWMQAQWTNAFTVYNHSNVYNSTFGRPLHKRTLYCCVCWDWACECLCLHAHVLIFMNGFDCAGFFPIPMYLECTLTSWLRFGRTCVRWAAPAFVYAIQREFVWCECIHINVTLDWLQTKYNIYRFYIILLIYGFKRNRFRNQPSENVLSIWNLCTLRIHREHYIKLCHVNVHEQRTYWLRYS